MAIWQPVKKLRSLGVRVKAFLFRNTSTRQTIVKNTFWLTVSNVGGRLLRAIIVIYAARILGAAGWGVFAYASSLIAFLSFFVDFGIGNILTKEIAKAGETLLAKQIISTSFFIKIAVLVPSILILIFVIPHFTKDIAVKMILPIATFIFIFDTMRDFGASIIRAMEKMEWEAGLSLLTNLGIVVFGFIILRLRPNVESFTYAYAFGVGLGMVATIYTLRSKFRDVLRYFSPALVRFIVASAWPLATSSLLGLLLTNTDVIIIGWLRSVEDVGLYSAVLRIVQVLYILPGILASSLLPTLSRLARRDNNKFRTILERSVSACFFIAIPIATGGILLASQIVAFVFGKSYLPATSSFQLLIATIIVDFSPVLLATAVFSYDDQRKLVIYSAIGGIANVVFDLLLIPVLGIAGSGLATLLAQTISTAYLWRTMKKINPFQIMPHLKKIIVASAGMALVIVALASTGAHLLAIIATAIISYFGILLLLKELLLKEARSILRLGASDVPASGESPAQ